MANSVSLEYLDDVLAKEINLTQTALCAQNTAGSSIDVIAGGAEVPLATIPYNNGFTPNGARTEFTVNASGVYLIEYSINLIGLSSLSSGVFKNGSPIANLTRDPGITVTLFNCAAIVGLTAGDKLRLMLYGLIAIAELQGGVSAYMNIIRIA